MEAASRFVLPGALLPITYASGFWLSVLGSPYHGLLFNLHKLIALFATGALMSIGDLPHAPLLAVRRIALAALPLAAIPMGRLLLAIQP